MPKTKLNKQQKPTVEAWCNEHDGRVIQIIDRSCRYREAIIEWSTKTLYPHLKQIAVVEYKTSLELTPTGSHSSRDSLLTECKICPNGRV